MKDIWLKMMTNYKDHLIGPLLNFEVFGSLENKGVKRFEPFFALLIFQEMRHRCYCLSDNIKCFFCHLTLNPFSIKDSDFFYNTLVKSYPN